MAEKRIGLVLALDGEKKFTQALQSAKKETNLYKTELKNLSQEFSGNANSMDALKAKQETLAKQQDAYQRKLNAAKTGLDNAKKAYNQQSDALEDLKKRLEEAKKAQQKMEDAGDTTSDAYRNQCKQVDELSDAVDKQGTNVLKASGRVTDWNKNILESERELRKVNKALDQNEQYLKEAESATDHCATSIDNMGNEVKSAEKQLEELGDEVKDTADDFEDASKGTSTFKQMLAANLTGTAIVNGLKAVGGAAIDAAKYAVEVGSSFEAAMSEVAAVSGASGSELDAMTEKAKELGSSTKFSATEAADAFKYMSLAGWSTSDMLSGIDGIMNLAAASGMELAAASDMVTDYLSAFGMQAGDSAYMADMLASAQASSNTTAEQLGEAYKNCAANLNASGQDIETTTSLLEAMANQGLKGSEAGTALTAMMRDITAKMKDGKIAIGDTSVAVMDANGNYQAAGRTLGEAVVSGLQEQQNNINDALSPDAESITGKAGDYQAAGEQLGIALAEGLASKANDAQNSGTGYDGDTLLYNLETQVKGLALWEQQLEELGQKGVTGALMEELQSLGPDAAANIWSLNQMTKEQLDQYVKLWEQKSALANSQAIKENEPLRNETNEQIAQLKKDAEKELSELNKTYKESIKQTTESISTELSALISKAGKIGEDAVAGLVKGIKKQSDSVDTYKHTNAAVSTLSDGLETLVPQGELIGKNTLDGLLAGLQDEDKIKKASVKVVNSIKRAMENEAEIHSPSRLFKRAIGLQMGAGVGTGLKESAETLEDTSRDVIRNTLAAAQKELASQQASLSADMAMLDTSGITALNNALTAYQPAAPIVNVDNSSVAGMMQQFMTGMQTMVKIISGMGVYINEDVLVGQIQPALSRESAAVTIRRNRGRR